MQTIIGLQQRARLKRAIRDFFGARDYLEVDTPIAVKCPGTEVHLRYFKTNWADYDGSQHQLYLRSSPELHMKQLLAMGAGMERIFQIAPCFRNGGELAEWHRPEFGMLEWYESGLSFTGLIDQTEALLHATHSALGSGLSIPQRLPRVSVAEAFERWAGVTLIDGDPELALKGTAAGAVSLRDDDDFETAFFKILIERIEPGLASLGAAVLYDYPASQAALAIVRDGCAKRFEIYFGRVELCNGFEELLDAGTNQERIRESNLKRVQLGYEVPEEDRNFYDALRKGLPPCSGNALGFDRWLALLCQASSLNEVTPFAFR
ncbi:MAG: EF-P lysine aminoacylase EpmA [Proteobacteria bacterium]|jgi:lysyl-tRNA synthetase class 2|nr:EF-P lysine aminoacylase EpmA [Pseudomonadota bacterium]